MSDGPQRREDDEGIIGLFNNIPKQVRVIVLIGVIFSAGVAFAALWADQLEYGNRLGTLEAEMTSLRTDFETSANVTRIRIRYLTCRAQQEDAGRDPSNCAILLEQLPPSER